jgi:hypothetical protein
MKQKTEMPPIAGRQVQVGDRATVDLGGRRFRGMVVEDRGPIGVGGRRLYRIEIADIEDVEPTGLELPAEGFEDLTSSGSARYVPELFEEIIGAAKRSNAEIIVSYSGRGDVQIRGRSMLPDIPRRRQIFREIDEMLVNEANSADGRIVMSGNRPSGHHPNQHWYSVRSATP